MSYVTRAEITSEIPLPHLIDAFDDDRDGAEDAGSYDAAVAAVATEIDGYLAGKFSVPFDDPAPAAVRAAAFVFLGEKIYARRELAEKNPFSARAKMWRERLALIGEGKAPLDASLVAAAPPGAAITETLTTYGGSA